MITGCLQQKNGFYYAVLYLKVNGRRRCKWVPMRLPVEGTSARKAQKAFDEIRLQYEREEEERLGREAKAKALAENTHPAALPVYRVHGKGASIAPQLACNGDLPKLL